jgi:hypothetical protein
MDNLADTAGKIADCFACGPRGSRFAKQAVDAVSCRE